MYNNGSVRIPVLVAQPNSDKEPFHDHIYSPTARDVVVFAYDIPNLLGHPGNPILHQLIYTVIDTLTAFINIHRILHE